MKKLVVLVGVLFLGSVIFGMGISYNNQYVRLSNLIKTKQVDNKSEFDNMWKKIGQSAQVTEKERDSLKQIFVEYANARTDDSANKVMTWVKESVPSVTPDMFKNLQNIITSSRDSWTMRQKEILDFKRELDNLLQIVPSKWFLLGKQTIDVVIITSEKTVKIFESGKDDDVKIFNNTLEQK